MERYVFLYEESEFRVKIEVEPDFEFTSPSLSFYLFIDGKPSGNCVVVPIDLRYWGSVNDRAFWVTGLGAMSGKQKFGFWGEAGE